MKQKSALTILVSVLTLLLAACGKTTSPETDKQAPIIHITSATTSATAQYTLEGIIHDNTSVESAAYTLNAGEPQELTLNDHEFSTTLTLAPNANTITVTATDKAENTGESTITVTYGAPPSGATSSSDIAARGSSSITITGSNFGSSGSITIGGEPATPSEWTDTSITLPVPGNAPSGPQELVITAAGGSETLELFVGVDYAEGSLEDLAALNLPKGTAVRLGEGTFESSSELLMLDNLSLYGQGEDKTTLEALGAGVDPHVLYFYANSGFDLVVTDLTLDADFTVVFPEPLSPPEFNSASFSALSGRADTRSFLESVVQAGGSESFSSMSNQENPGSFELRNVNVLGAAGEGALATVDIMSFSELPYPGRLILDNVEYDNEEHVAYLVAGESVEIRDSNINIGMFLVGSFASKTVITDSQLRSLEPGAYSAVVGVRGMEIRDSEFVVTETDFEFSTNLGGFVPITGESIVSNNSIMIVDVNGDPVPTEGGIRMEFIPTTATVEGNTFTVNEGVYMAVYSGGLLMDGNTFNIVDENPGSTVYVKVESYMADYVAFNNNTVNFGKEGGLVFAGDGKANFIVNDNTVTGADNEGVAFAAEQEWSDIPFSLAASGNTFTGFEQALDIYRRQTGDGHFTLELNNNDFDFPITAAGQAATVRGHFMAGEADLDATNNQWGAHTDASDVENLITYGINVDPSIILKVDPITIP